MDIWKKYLVSYSGFYHLNLTPGYDMSWNSPQHTWRESELISITLYFIQQCTCDLCWLHCYPLGFPFIISVSLLQWSHLMRMTIFWFTRSSEYKMQSTLISNSSIFWKKKRERRHGAFQNTSNVSWHPPFSTLTLVVWFFFFFLVEWITDWQICMLRCEFTLHMGLVLKQNRT